MAIKKPNPFVLKAATESSFAIQHDNLGGTGRRDAQNEMLNLTDSGDDEHFERQTPQKKYIL